MRKKITDTHARLAAARAALAALQEKHAPALAAQRAALDAVDAAQTAHEQDCDRRGAAHLKAVGYTPARALKAVLGALDCTQSDVDNHELMSSKYFSPDTDVTRAVRAIETTIRRAARTPDDAAETLRLRTAHTEAYRLAHYDSEEHRAIKVAERAVHDLEIEVSERERKSLSAKNSKEKKAKTDPRLVEARKLLREGFAVEAFGVTTKVVGHGK
jgi:hypothetical protein